MHAHSQCTKFTCNILTLTFYASDVVLARDISSYHDDHLCQIILKSWNAGQTYRTATSLFYYSIQKKFITLCDLDLQVGHMIFACNTSSKDEDHLCQIVLKYYNTEQNYELHTSLCHCSLCTKSTCTM